MCGYATKSAHRADLEALFFPRRSKCLGVLEWCKLHKVEWQVWLIEYLTPTVDERQRLVDIDGSITLYAIALSLIYPVVQSG